MGTPDEPTKEKEIPSIAARIKRFVLVASVRLLYSPLASRPEFVHTQAFSI